MDYRILITPEDNLDITRRDFLIVGTDPSNKRIQISNEMVEGDTYMHQMTTKYTPDQAKELVLALELALRDVDRDF